MLRCRLRFHLRSECVDSCLLGHGRPEASYSLVLGDVSLEHPLGVPFRIGSLPRTIARAFQEDVVGGVDQPIERAFGEDGVREERVPLLWRAVAGDDGRASPDALADELVQILALTFRECAEAEVVDLLRCRSNATYPDLAIIPTPRG
jgi:hypothetical protein